LEVDIFEEIGSISVFVVVSEEEFLILLEVSDIFFISVLLSGLSLFDLFSGIFVTFISLLSFFCISCVEDFFSISFIYILYLRK